MAVNLKGARVGKGGGFSDLEYALLCESGKIDRRTVIATTVHPIQILRENLLMTAHDIPVGLVATPRAVIEVDGAHRGPRASSGTTSSRRRSTRSRCWSGSATWLGPRSTGSSWRAQLGPVARADHPVALDDLPVPGVQDRGRHDAGLAGPHDVDRAVVHQHVDARARRSG